MEHKIGETMTTKLGKYEILHDKDDAVVFKVLDGEYEGYMFGYKIRPDGLYTKCVSAPDDKPIPPQTTTMEICQGLLFTRIHFDMDDIDKTQYRG